MLNPFRRRKSEEKLNPVQQIIVREEGTAVSSTENVANYRMYYETLEIVNRAVNMVVDDASEIPVEMDDSKSREGVTPVATGARKASVLRILNKEPNPFQDISTFRRNLFTDLIVDGNAFIYYDGVHLYHLPANKVIIHPDPKTYVSYYEYAGSDIKYTPNEIIHIKENSFRSIYRGISRLKPASRTMKLLVSMRDFQDNFFTNGAVPGLVLRTPDTLSDKIKDRLMASWMLKYNPKSGGRRPMILDGGLEVDQLSKIDFKELDFKDGVQDLENTILSALGVPEVLFKGGNNANITPNLRLYYVETILPLVRKVNHAYSRYFGYEIWDNLSDIEAMQKDLRDHSGYLSTLVNGGILTPNEARSELGKEEIEGGDEIRIPANIAGSAADPSTGGRPSEGEED